MFSIGIAPAHPFLMSEQSPRIIKLRQSVYARSNIQPLRQTEISPHTKCGKYCENMIK